MDSRGPRGTDRRALDDVAQESVFSEDRIRLAGLVGFVAAALVPLIAVSLGGLIYWLLGGVFGPLLAALAGLAAAGVSGLFVFDYLCLGWFNRWLRDRLQHKLRRLGVTDMVEADPTVYFVGLAHPAKVSPWRFETDDDIGFLKVDFDTITYHGDRGSFRLPFDQIERIEMEPVGYGFPSSIKRLRLVTTEGEPFEELLLSVREGDRLSSGNRVTRTLHEALVSRWERSATGRLTRLTDSTADLDHLLAAEADRD